VPDGLILSQPSVQNSLFTGESGGFGRNILFLPEICKISNRPAYLSVKDILAIGWPSTKTSKQSENV